MGPRLDEEVDELDSGVFDDDDVPDEPEAWLMEDLRDLGLSGEVE
jgi:hypothetical protein